MRDAIMLEAPADETVSEDAGTHTVVNFETLELSQWENEGGPATE